MWGKSKTKSDARYATLFARREFPKGGEFMSEQTKYVLQESEMPTAWYNIQHDFETPLPPVINPGTGQPIGPADLAPLFPMQLIMQEVGVGPYATDYIDIPEEVQDIY